MIDPCYRILLMKYCPDSPLLQAQVELTKSVRKQVVSVVMSANDYPTDTITAACSLFNTEYPERQSNSYTLPTAWQGIPKDSWIFISYEEDLK